MREPVAELVTQVDHAIVRCAAVGTGIAAIFDQRDRSVGRAEKMIPVRIDGRIEPLAPGSVANRLSLNRPFTDAIRFPGKLFL